MNSCLQTCDLLCRLLHCSVSTNRTVAAHCALSLKGIPAWASQRLVCVNILGWTLGNWHFLGVKHGSVFYFINLLWERGEISSHTYWCSCWSLSRTPITSPFLSWFPRRLFLQNMLWPPHTQQTLTLFPDWLRSSLIPVISTCIIHTGPIW